MAGYDDYTYMHRSVRVDAVVVAGYGAVRGVCVCVVGGRSAFGRPCDYEAGGGITACLPAALAITVTTTMTIARGRNVNERLVAPLFCFLV